MKILLTSPVYVAAMTASMATEQPCRHVYPKRCQG
jgi:hypothetical protein